MSVFTLLRRRAAAGTGGQSGDSWLDAWARNRGAALVRSVVRAAHPDA